jgi:hypothetical protein
MASKIKVDQLETADGSGTIALQNQLSGLTSASMPTGSVIQVVQNYIASETSSTSTSYVATAGTITVTPQFSNSKILISVQSFFWNKTASAGGVLTIYRGSTDLAVGTHMARIYPLDGGKIQHHVNIAYLDSPNTTSATTYTVYMKNAYGTSEMKFGSNAAEGITMMAQEIKG